MECLKAMIEMKADMNAKDKDKETALHKAVKLGYLDVIEALLDMSADIEETGTSKILIRSHPKLY